MLHYFFGSSDPKAWKFQKVELPKQITPYIDNTDENKTKCYLHLKLPWTKKSGGSDISYIITMIIRFSWNLKVLLWKINKIFTKCVFASFWNVIIFCNIFVHVHNQEQWFLYIFAIIIVLYKERKAYIETNINSTSEIHPSSLL